MGWVDLKAMRRDYSLKALRADRQKEEILPGRTHHRGRLSLLQDGACRDAYRVNPEINS